MRNAEIVPPSLLVRECTSVSKTVRAPALMGVEEIKSDSRGALLYRVGREDLLVKVGSK